MKGKTVAILTGAILTMTGATMPILALAGHKHILNVADANSDSISLPCHKQITIPSEPMPLGPKPPYSRPGSESAYMLGDALGKLTLEKSKRKHFTQDFVKQATKQCPGYNVVVSHNGGQVKGSHVIQQHYELDIAFGHTVGFKICFFPKNEPGTFVRNGDGSPINWGYNPDGFNRINANTIAVKVHR